MHQPTELSFVDEFQWVSPLHYLKKRWQTLFFFGACCKLRRHLYTTTAPSCCIPASYCHLSATFQTTSIIVVNLQDNRAVFRIFIAFLRFSFDSPSYTNLSARKFMFFKRCSKRRVQHEVKWGRGGIITIIIKFSSQLFVPAAFTQRAPCIHPVGHHLLWYRQRAPCIHPVGHHLLWYKERLVSTQ